MFAPKEDRSGREEREADAEKRQKQQEQEHEEEGSRAAAAEALKKKWAKQEEAAEEEKRLTKPQRKEEKRLRTAMLKQLVAKPEVVDMHDVTSPDPLLLVHLKTLRSAVPVPRHWKQKRKYLQGKRGTEKIPFQLPEYIAATGVATMRQAQLEKEAQKSVKTQQRSKLQPKSGKLDIDYRVLHDAFFKHQTRPNLTLQGDLYWEGKEYEVDVRAKRPGALSAKLRAALGMSDKAPPPWLQNQQRVGPPPSYPQLRIPGVNAPLPPGCEYGFHTGGWGKPPVDQWDRPLFGDVYGQQKEDDSLARGLMEPLTTDTTSRWGTLVAEQYVEEVEEEEEPEQEEQEAAVLEEPVSSQAAVAAAATGQQQLLLAGMAPGALESVETLELRKKVAATIGAMGTTQGQPQVTAGQGAARVLPQRSTNVGDGLYGSSFQYVIEDPANKAAATGSAGLIRSQQTAPEIVALEPEELEGDVGATLRQKFQAITESQSGRVASGAERRELDEIHAQHSKQKPKKKKTKKEDSFSFK